METDEPTTVPTLPDSIKLTNGRDEMNLAEFPLFALQRRANDVTELKYETTFRDKITGKRRVRRVTFQGNPEYGLPTAEDADILFALTAYAKQFPEFKRKNYFDVPFLIEELGWTKSGSNYQRVRLAIQRWDHTSVVYDGWWDAVQRKYLDDVTLWFFDGHYIADNRGKTGDARTHSWFRFSDDFYTALSGDYIRKIDLEIFFKLKTPIAKHMYRFLGKRFYHADHQTFDLEKFGKGHMGLSGEYPVSHLKRKLKRSIGELEALNLIATANDADRFIKRGKGQYEIVFDRGRDYVLPKDANQDSQQPGLFEPPIVMRLTEHGYDLAAARKLSEDDNFSDEMIEEKIELLEWSLSQGKDIADPASWLCKAIMQDYTPPKQFKSKAARDAEAKRIAAKQKQLAAQRAKIEAAAKKKAEQEAAEKASQNARIDAYLASLSAGERERLEDEALAGAGSFARKRVGPYLRNEDPDPAAKVWYDSIIHNHVISIIE
ncbi:replication initiator protein A [Crateriforma conspicua]|uniref:Replication initiator protein A n=1 Tax=Crateriforma conspicua TaxID=2527996 RepID=A0A5C6FGI2_9PLAN|nr:replication initiator protein A [Crateriforma conspicua]TWU59635.1 Replication initiator protein A [Crateriforma conspicua]